MPLTSFNVKILRQYQGNYVTVGKYLHRKFLSWRRNGSRVRVHTDQSNYLCVGGAHFDSEQLRAVNFLSSAEDLRALICDYLIVFVWRVSLYLMFFTWETLIRTDGFAKVVSRGTLIVQVTNVVLSFALVANGFGVTVRLSLWSPATLLQLLTCCEKIFFLKRTHKKSLLGFRWRRKIYSSSR